jgi:hypothetical protein
MFLVPTSHWQQGKCARINMSQAASGMILQSQAAIYTHFGCQKIAASKEQAKTLSKIFHQLKNKQL